MNQLSDEQAKRLLLEGALLVLEGLPKRSEFGLDTSMAVIGEKFKGIKMIPPGLHLVHFSIASQDGQQSPKAGFFHFFHPQECLIKVVDTLNEELVPDNQIPNHLRELYQFQNISQFDGNLAPYSLEVYNEWLSLSDCISSSLLNRLVPLSGFIDGVSHDKPRTFRSSRSGGREPESADAGKLDPERCIRFTKLPTRFLLPPGATSMEVSRHSMDSSYTVQRLFFRESIEHSHILGELQFAFIVFLLCHVQEGFEQWKQLIKLLCHARDLLHVHPELFIQLIRVMHFQMSKVPQDLFVDIVEQDNFLYRTLRELFENITAQEESLDQSLIQTANAFQKHLSDQFGWDLLLQLDDEAPVILEDETGS